jgi:hypothetical protein
LPVKIRAADRPQGRDLPVQDLVLGGDAGVPGQDGRLGGEQAADRLAQAESAGKGFCAGRHTGKCTRRAAHDLLDSPFP